ncbi:hypothetical protein NDU88_005669 [Pleurodeles waltl]|uniref:Uncharacterized protein n=1 Tax=Pleurodeles waltl TaxID=8319 RepID=A0AAV7RLP2_PLEWA|nr:hypothetical protein NDU88_005669 [Pleurodeles waltl]
MLLNWRPCSGVFHPFHVSFLCGALSLVVVLSSPLRHPHSLLFYNKACSQELESPAISEPCESDNKDIGNPDEQIPDPLPEHHGDEDAIAITGNPDIRVPDVIKRDNGLHACCALRKEDAEEDAIEKRRRRQSPSRRPQKEDQKNPSTGDTATGKEGPEEHEHRHVPGGTWLNQVKPGTESWFSEPCESDNKDIGNPDERIPDPLPEHHGDEDAIAITGNPDIRVPEVIERDNGLHACCALRTEDAEEDAAEKRRRQSPSRRPQEEDQKNSSIEDTAMGKEGPEEREHRHVPGGTWLNQVRSYLKDSLRLKIEREGAAGGESRGGEGREEGDKKGGGKRLRRVPE